MSHVAGFYAWTVASGLGVMNAAKLNKMPLWWLMGCVGIVMVAVMAMVTEVITMMVMVIRLD